MTEIELTVLLDTLQLTIDRLQKSHERLDKRLDNTIAKFKLETKKEQHNGA